MVDSIEFAKLIISRAKALEKDGTRNFKLAETKLQKLLYICDGYLLAAGFNLISEQAKAWNYGPVYPRIHTWLQKEPGVFETAPECSAQAGEELDKYNAPSLVDVVLDIYGSWTAGELSNWSHGPGSPWETALEKGKGVMNSVIDKDDMKKYFQELTGAPR
jgi:uncharacterized phage-associated protein